MATKWQHKNIDFIIIRTIHLYKHCTLFQSYTSNSFNIDVSIITLNPLKPFFLFNFLLIMDNLLSILKEVILYGTISQRVTSVFGRQSVTLWSVVQTVFYFSSL